MFIYFDINIVPRQSECALYVDYFIIQDKCHVFLCENTFSNNVRIPILLSSLKSGRGSEYGFSSWPSCPIFIHLSLMICCKVNKQKFLKKKVKLQYYFSRSSLSINALCICVYIYIKFDQPQFVNVAFSRVVSQHHTFAVDPSLSADHKNSYAFNVFIYLHPAALLFQGTHIVVYRSDWRYLPCSIHFSEFMPIFLTRKRTKDKNTLILPYSYDTKMSVNGY